MICARSCPMICVRSCPIAPQDKAEEDRRDADFENKMKTVDSRLERFQQAVASNIDQRIADRAKEGRERDERNALLKYQREMSGASGMDKAQMKELVCQQAFERKRDMCLTQAVENQMRYQSRLAYIAQQQRIEAARVQRMTEQSELKTLRSQSVIDAKVRPLPIPIRGWYCGYNMSSAPV
jgi:hypothetical protein